MALVNYAESDGSTDISDDETSDNEVVQNKSISTSKPKTDFNDSVEDEFKMRIPKHAKPLLQPLDIKRKTTLSGKVLLSIPTLEELNSSDDSDDEIEKQRKSQKPVARAQNAKSLLDMLPPTQALVARERARPMMVPYQVSKPRSVASSCKKQEPSKPPSVTVDEGEEDEFDDITFEEGDGNSFFSFYDQKKEEERFKSIAPPPVLLNQKICVPNILQSPTETEGLPPLLVKPFTDSELPKPSSSSSASVRRDEADTDELEEVPEPTWSESSFIPGPERKRARMSRCEVIGARPTPVLEMLSKHQVKEVRQDDLTAGAKLQLIKSVTEDVRRRKPEAIVDQPGKLAFRKHQITWLAYKAQENEYELQDQWAEARRNHTQSRAKYGF